MYLTKRNIALSLWAIVSLIAPLAFADSPGDVDNPGVYPKPPAPPLPGAGGIITDPTFGTQILRVTDPATHPRAALFPPERTTNSAFNAGSTVFYILQTSPKKTFLFYRIVEQPLAVVKIDELGSYTQLAWHPTDPNVLYGTVGRAIWQITFPAKSTQLVHNFSADLPGNGYAAQTPHVDRVSARYFAQTAASGVIGCCQDQYDYVAVYDRQLNRSVSLNVLQRTGITSKGVHGIEMDNSGRYVLISFPGGPVFLWEWAVDRLENWGYVQQRFGGHRSLGDGIVLNPVNGADLFQRDMSLPPAQTPMLAFQAPRKNGKANWYEDKHFSRVSRDGRLIAAYYVPSKNRAYANQDWRPLMEEIVEIRLMPNAPATWRRLAHHRNVHQRGWPPHPRANASPDARWVLFRSNWDAALSRPDIFLLRVPPERNGT